MEFAVQRKNEPVFLHRFRDFVCGGGEDIVKTTIP